MSQFDNLSNSLVLANADPGVNTPPLKKEINSLLGFIHFKFCFINYLTGMESVSSSRVIAQLIINLDVEMYPGSKFITNKSKLKLNKKFKYLSSRLTWTNHFSNY